VSQKKIIFFVFGRVEPQKPRKLGVFGFSPPPPPLNVNVVFGRYFFNLTLCMTKLMVSVLSFPEFTDISIE